MKCGQTRHPPSKPPTLSASLSLSSRLTGCPCFIQPATVCRPQGNERRRGRPVSRSQDGADAGRAWRGAPGRLGAGCWAPPTWVLFAWPPPPPGCFTWDSDPRLAQALPSSEHLPQAHPRHRGPWTPDLPVSALMPLPPGSLPRLSRAPWRALLPRAFSHIAAVITVTQLPPAWMPVCCLPPPASPPRGRDCDSVQWPLLNGRKKVNVQQTCPAHP